MSAAYTTGGPGSLRSRSFTTPPSRAQWATCSRCGSTLTGRHLEAKQQRVLKGLKVDVDIFRCRCGQGRQVRRAA